MYKWLASILIIAAATTGCSTAAKNEPTPQYNDSVKVKQNNGSMNIADTGQVSAHLEQLAQSVNGVISAHCVVIGKTAIVGLDLDDKLDRAQVGVIKYAVAEALRHGPEGIEPLVTADMGLSERLREMGDDIRRGSPVSGFAEELSDIVGRIMPQFSRDTIPKDVPGVTNETNRGR